MSTSKHLTIAEFGAKLKKSPAFLKEYGESFLATKSDKDIGMMVLSKHPKYWDAIDPAARRVAGLIHKSIEGAGFFEDTRIRNTSGRISNLTSEANAINQVSVVAAATAEGLPTAVYQEVVAHPQRIQQREDNAALDLKIQAAQVQLQMDQLAVTKEIEYQHLERTEQLRVKTDAELEAIRVKSALDLEKGQAAVGLDAARRAELDKLLLIDEIDRRLAEARQAHEAVRTDRSLPKSVREGRLKDYAAKILRYEAMLNG